MKTRHTTVFEVWRQDTEGRDISSIQFDNLLLAAKYAIGHAGKIAYGIPKLTVTRTTYFYEDNSVLTDTDWYEDYEIQALALMAVAREAEGKEI